MIFGLYHSATEEAGLVAQVLKSQGIRFKPVHLYHGEGLPRDTSDLEGLVVMGGPMNVDDVAEFPFLLPEVQLIEKVLSGNKPILGVCLGSQLIAKALGGRVYPGKQKELGWAPIHRTAAGTKDPLFSNLPDKSIVLHWHGDTFDLPKGAVHLAKSARFENQAFKWGEGVYALQFHLEATPAMVQEWCQSKDGAREIAAAGVEPAQILLHTPAAYNRLEPHALEFLSDYSHLAFRKLRTAVA